MEARSTSGLMYEHASCGAVPTDWVVQPVKIAIEHRDAIRICLVFILATENLEHFVQGLELCLVSVAAFFLELKDLCFPVVKLGAGVHQKPVGLVEFCICLFEFCCKLPVFLFEQDVVVGQALVDVFLLEEFVGEVGLFLREFY